MVEARIYFQLVTHVKIPPLWSLVLASSYLFFLLSFRAYRSCHNHFVRFLQHNRHVTAKDWPKIGGGSSNRRDGTMDILNGLKKHSKAHNEEQTFWKLSKLLIDFFNNWRYIHLQSPRSPGSVHKNFFFFLGNIEDIGSMQ